MERLLKSHAVEYLEVNGLLSEFQFGFRKGRSTEDQLLLMYDKVGKWVDQGFLVDVVYLDFSRAFDVVSHQILLDKLCCLGFDSLVVEWIRSFLVGRRFSVSVSGVRSSSRDVVSGVPQGSVLGPVLFLIYANFIASGVECVWSAFADDFKLCICYPRRDSEAGDVGRSALQRSISSVAEKSGTWNLTLNPSKCVVIRFGGGRSDLSERVPYTLGGVDIRFVRSYRDLGVEVDEGLKFHVHVDAVVRKAGGLIGNLLRSTKCRNQGFMTALFVSHIRPVIEYCSSVWNVGYLGDMNRLESLQRRWTREVDGLRGLDYEDRLQRCGLFSVRGRLLRQDLIRLWKAFNSEVDVGLSGIFERAAEVNTRGHRWKLSVPVCHTEIRRRSLAARCVRLWNGLPSRVVEAESVGIFKKRLGEQLGGDLFSVR